MLVYRRMRNHPTYLMVRHFWKPIHRHCIFVLVVLGYHLKDRRVIVVTLVDQVTVVFLDVRGIVDIRVSVDIVDLLGTLGIQGTVVSADTRDIVDVQEFQATVAILVLVDTVDTREEVVSVDTVVTTSRDTVGVLEHQGHREQVVFLVTVVHQGTVVIQALVATQVSVGFQDDLDFQDTRVILESVGIVDSLDIRVS